MPSLGNALTAPLRSNWTRLILKLNERDYLTFKDQNICSSKPFYKIMDALCAAGWARCEWLIRGGCIKQKRYAITFEGALIAWAFEGKI